MKIYEYGLSNTDDNPKAYKLSAILSGYYGGFKKRGFECISIKCKDADVKSDGSFDFSVPKRHKAIKPNLLNNIKLALEVIKGKASILYYE